ncbi:F-box/kelch-repeat protein At1g67480-like [Phragmites australis]|uniref:F-box/kelch-repeat protein At1g67480-like n=1 Tax=Phragmites australis TaxID=29695 RepID=UPI002D765666|nr:F-box/kelch-repeat protein At1g67480-like [Phragmites australis]
MGSLHGDVGTSPCFSSSGSSSGSSRSDNVGGGNGRFRIYACFALGDSNSLECYEPSANTWCRMGALPDVPDGHILKGFAVVALAESVYVIGGRLCRRERGATTGEYRDTDVSVRADVLRYDVRRGEWHHCTPLLVPRFDFACAPCQGRICVAGGQSSLSGARGTAAAEVYDAEKDQWSALPDMSTLRYKCVGVTWQGSFHVVGGFAESTSSASDALLAPGTTVPQSSALERSSAEVFHRTSGTWEIIPGMWQLDVPPNQIVAVAGRLFSSGDCLNSWKGHVEVYDGELNIWSIMDHSALPDLSLLASLPPSAQRLYLTMAVVDTRLYFLAGYQVPSGDDSFRTVSLVHSFDTSAAPGLVPAWSSFQPKMDQENVEDGSKELFSQCCSVQLSS